MFRNLLQKHNKSLCYALLTLIFLSNFIYIPTSAAIDVTYGSATTPAINLFKDLPTGENNTSFIPEQLNPTKDVSFKRCLTDNICTLGEFFSNVWNKGQNIIYKIFNPNPDLNVESGVSFLQKPYTNPNNPNQVLHSIKVPNYFPNNNGTVPYNLYSCEVHANNGLPQITTCNGHTWVEGVTQLPNAPYKFVTTKSPSLIGIIIKSCFNLCVFADSSTIDNNGALPPQFAPEPQPTSQPQPEPSRRLKYTVHCRDANTGIITQTMHYSEPYLHSQGYTKPIKIECPTSKRITQTNIYEEKYINNTWIPSEVTNNNQGDINNNNTGNITNIYYPQTVISQTNQDANCIIGNDSCKPDIVKSSNNGAVSCFNNAPNCQDFQSEVVTKINNNTYNPQTSQYQCVYNGRIVDMQQCKPIFNVITNNQTNIFNNTPNNQKSLQDARECAPAGLQTLNPFAYAQTTACIFEVLFVPSPDNNFRENIINSFYQHTGLAETAEFVDGLKDPVITAMNSNSTYCQGLDVNIPLNIVENWGDTPDKYVTVYLFSHCDGILKNISDIWMPIVSGAVYMSGFVIIINMILGAWGIRLFFKGGTGMDVAP
jgi:hypothetical protein